MHIILRTQQQYQVLYLNYQRQQRVLSLLKDQIQLTNNILNSLITTTRAYLNDEGNILKERLIGQLKSYKQTLKRDIKNQDRINKRIIIKQESQKKINFNEKYENYFKICGKRPLRQKLELKFILIRITKRRNQIQLLQLKIQICSKNNLKYIKQIQLMLKKGNIKGFSIEIFNFGLQSISKQGLQRRRILRIEFIHTQCFFTPSYSLIGLKLHRRTAQRLLSLYFQFRFPPCISKGFSLLLLFVHVFNLSFLFFAIYIPPYLFRFSEFLLFLQTLPKKIPLESPENVFNSPSNTTLNSHRQFKAQQSYQKVHRRLAFY
ncbi:unnamed protein product (macronuclear) [Paramecium tetraurelia]|uniref:Transmembrane protein n=1 Tax=Paramecium tetraurelia TaxID=5888 RepID=A0D4C4_PARTE|nr:uncharacterized protein GSPATT00013357001 [Paramecium tetraurelia]CAK77891.1 unnamed protein product [Paramecium tetraurelia]|eukprot:XP_001445288.1 hypothetical protein (macronuclear) [Paramecium tetraurelia strain d4-2]